MNSEKRTKKKGKHAANFCSPFVRLGSSFPTIVVDRTKILFNPPSTACSTRQHNKKEIEYLK